MLVPQNGENTYGSRSQKDARRGCSCTCHRAAAMLGKTAPPPTRNLPEMKRASIIVAVLATVAPAAAQADALQAQLLASARATQVDRHGFRRTITIERSGAARRVVEERYDPRRAPADRWSLLSIDGRTPTAKEVADMHKAKRGPVPSYAEIAKFIGAPATRSDTAPGFVTYRFARLPKGAIKIGNHDASADLAAEALVDTRGKTPFVAQVRLTATKGFRMMMVVSVKAMTIVTRYRALADGHLAPADNASTIDGSLLGKSGQIKTAVRFADFAAVR
ncbi:MAG TPA: hypothetical protein VM900_07685 [Sphingomonas sp.]|nr:hypothetical protein [Sphingomonas sp.]